MTPRSYELFEPSGQRLLSFAFFALLTFGGLVMLVPASLRGVSGNQFPFALVILTVAGFGWYHILTVPRRIHVHPGDEIEFVSILRRQRIPASAIYAVKAARNQAGFLHVKHTHGVIRLYACFTGFHSFLSELQSVNPNVEFVGC